MLTSFGDLHMLVKVVALTQLKEAAMAEYQVNCINKQPRDNPYDRIDTIGVITSEGVRKFSVADIVHFIEQEGHRFFVQKNGKKVFLEVGTSLFGNKYVKTNDDGEPLNNLLNLGECA